MFHSPSLSVAPPQNLFPVVPAEIAGFLGAPPLLPGQDGSAYAVLTARVAQAVAPRDVIEWFWIRDIVDNTWESLRLWRMRASLLALGQRHGVQEVLRQIGVEVFDDDQGGQVDSEAVAQAYVEGDPIWVGAVATQAEFVPASVFDRYERKALSRRRRLVRGLEG